ncbi:MAG TPA: cellulose biosynthesis protein BcsG [Rhodocyclaceae bacterium]
MQARAKVFSPAGLGGWNAYFLAKFLMLWLGLISFHPLENLAFAAVLLVPFRSDRWRRMRSVAAWPVAVALLYFDSWLPPFRRALSQANLLTNFSFDYLVELADRFVSLPVVAALALTLAAYLILARWLRFSVLVMGALLALAVNDGLQASRSRAERAGMAHAAQADDKDALLRSFFAAESARRVAMHAPAPGAAPFDVIIVQVCSLSWDDLRAVGQDSHPLWQQFDLLLTRFNSASAYSGPAAIRILRAPCGQQAHGDLYNPAPAPCYLMGSLQQAGLEPALALNHNGKFDDFLKFVRAQRGLEKTVPLALDGLAEAQHSFDGSPIYDDADVLGRWLEARRKSPAARVALFYNTISLHDGNKLAGQASGASLDTYGPRVKRLLDDLQGFVQSLERSGRRAVLVVVPEHGAAIRGDRMQVAGLREIPSPAITLVPVGIKVIGGHRSDAQVRVDEPTSYLAVAEVISRMVARSPFAGGSFSAAEYADALPVTSFVAQNEDAAVMETGGRYFLKVGKEDWAPYAAEMQ